MSAGTGRVSCLKGVVLGRLRALQGMATPLRVQRQHSGLDGVKTEDTNVGQCGMKLGGIGGQVNMIRIQCKHFSKT